MLASPKLRSRLMLSASTRKVVPLTVATSSTGPDVLPGATKASALAGNTAVLTNDPQNVIAIVLQGHTDQCFGEWSGSFTTADGEVIEFDGLIGWAEEVHNRW